jgi:hypothetical protein
LTLSVASHSSKDDIDGGVGFCGFVRYGQGRVLLPTKPHRIFQ